MNKISRICLHIAKVVLTIVLLCRLVLTIIIHRHSWKYSIGTYSPIFCTIALIICFMIIKPDDLEENQYTQKISSKGKICLRIVSAMLTIVFLCGSALTIIIHRHSWKYSINTYSPIFCTIAFIICFIYIKPKKRVKWTLIGLGLIVLYRYLRRFISMIYYTNYARTLTVLSISIILISAILIRKMIKIHDIIKIGKIGKWTIIILLFLALGILGLGLTRGFKLLYGSICVKMSSYNYKCCDLVDCYTYMDYPDGVDKPIIYIYPTTETEVSVKLGTQENLSHTYPKYNPEKGWNVIAQPNGNLKDIETGRELYALYREGKSSIETNFDEGFIVEGKDIIPFLEEKLAILGLNEREVEEFIVYWLPQMENNKYNLIRFETTEEQNKTMPLNITPKPDTIIRVMMDWKAIDEPIDVPNQKLSTPERSGFTVVERGGSSR